MFDDIEAQCTQRITEIREYIDFISPLIPAPPVAPPRYLNTSKGLVFVQLYGLIEFTVLKTIEKTIACINSENLTVKQIKPVLLGLALNSSLDSLIDANRSKWDKRHDLFDKIDRDVTVVIESHLLPTDGKNIQLKQLESIKNIFCISQPIFHDIRFTSRIREIVQNRINVAHGNSSASDVGASYTTTDLLNRLTEVSAFCSYFISVFDDYIESEAYLV
ncbi:MAE_28990/MAE_18760 family HEPN-like nuclease [Mucilaginibacter lacusdianchii]|uniref:MAE_28990/MAE_18760 family HEPN-like nuclease n=1 Tax=Mucilaginibacter lacusdianchii TaxID=2684211 RepID=UPI00131E082C|nr:MAE_28990/MAE_18760 family HEPN-like nuclease [Mucilaginibacter sp. JXJ CY 39]